MFLINEIIFIYKHRNVSFAFEINTVDKRNNIFKWLKIRVLTMFCESGFSLGSWYIWKSQKHNNPNNLWRTATLKEKQLSLNFQKSFFLIGKKNSGFHKSLHFLALVLIIERNKFTSHLSLIIEVAVDWIAWISLLPV